MELECEIDGGRYFLFGRSEGKRWPVVPAGADVHAERRGMTREEAARTALLAGFSTGEAEGAIRSAELRTGSPAGGFRRRLNADDASD